MLLRRSFGAVAAAIAKLAIPGLLVRSADQADRAALDDELRCGNECRSGHR